MKTNMSFVSRFACMLKA